MLFEILAGIFAGKEIISEARKPVIPAENWRNSELMYKDKVERLIPHEVYMENLRNGRYYLPDVPPNAKIDNMEKYKEDCKKDFCKAYRAAERGEYENGYMDRLYEEIRQKYNCKSDSLCFYYWVRDYKDK